MKKRKHYILVFFAASVGNEASKLTDLEFSIFTYILFSHNFERNFLEPIIEAIYTSTNITESKRAILINEGSQSSYNFLEIIKNLTITEQPSQHKKNGL